MATYKDGLKNLLSSDRFTSRVTPFRLAMMERIRDRARRDEAVLVPERFPEASIRPKFIAAEGEERRRLGLLYFEAVRFRFYHRGSGRVRPDLRNESEGWPGYHLVVGWPKYRSGMEKRKKKKQQAAPK